MVMNKKENGVKVGGKLNQSQRRQGIEQQKKQAKL